MTTTTGKLLTEIPKLLQECCDYENFRYDLRRPFVEEGFVWATDGKILARQPAADFDSEFLRDLMENRGKLPKATPVWDAYDDSGIWDDLPKGVSIPCETCNGVERVECFDCHGARRELIEGPCVVGVAQLMPHYVSVLLEHGIRSVKVTGVKSPVRFQIDRIEGVLMPLDPDEKGTS